MGGPVHGGPVPVPWGSMDAWRPKRREGGHRITRQRRATDTGQADWQGSRETWDPQKRHPLPAAEKAPRK